MRDRNTDHENVKVELEALAQNRNVSYEETDEMKVEDVISVSH